MNKTKWRNIQEDITREEAWEFFLECLRDSLGEKTTIENVYTDEYGVWNLEDEGGKYYAILNGQLYKWNKRELVFDYWMGDFWVELGFKLFDFQDDEEVIKPLANIKETNKEILNSVNEIVLTITKLEKLKKDLLNILGTEE